MKPCSRNTFLVTGSLLAMFLLHPAGQEAFAADQGANPDKICKYKKKKCSSCSSGDCSSDSSAEDDTVKIKVAHNEECKTDPTEAGLSDEYEFAGSEPVQPPKGRRSSDEPPVKMAGGFSSNYVHPKNLKLYGTGGEIVRDSDTNVRQVKGDTGFMDVIFTPATKTLELRLYNPDSIEQKKLNGVYPIKAGEKALTIIRYVQEADDRVRTEKVDNAAEFPSVKSERVTQEVGTEPYTLIQTKTYLKGEGSSAIEYKRVSKKMTVVLNGAPKEEKYQYSQEEMGSDGQWYLTERKAGRRAIYKEEDGFVTLYECNAVNEDGTPMAPIATETTYTYYNDPLQVGSHGKIKTLRRNDGYWENKYYDNNASAGLETEKTESPWLDTAAHEPGAAPSGDIRIKTEISCSTDTGIEDITETVNGILIAKEWTEKTPYDHQKVKEVRHQPHSGGDKITTTIRYRKASDIPTHLTGKPLSIHNADGSMQLYSYELKDQNLIVTEDQGYGEGNVVNHGIRTVSIQDKSNGKLKEEVRYAIEGGQSYWLSSKTGVTFDGKGTCLKWVYNNDPDDYTEQRKDCCQVTWERGRDGIEATYTYDVAGKQTSSTTRGITYTTEYNGLITFNWKQATGSNNRYLINQITKNEAGQIIGKTKSVVGNKTLVTRQIYNIPERKITTVTPTQTQSEIIRFVDGKIKNSTGTTGLISSNMYAPVSENGGGIVKTTTSGERYVTIMYDLLNNELSSDLNNGAITKKVYSSQGKLIKTVQPDGEETLYQYQQNVLISGLDVDKDGILNPSIDRISKQSAVFDPSWPENKGSWKTITSSAWQGEWKDLSFSWRTEDGTLSRTQMSGIAGYTIKEQPLQSEKGRNYVTVQRTSDGQTYETSYTLSNGAIASADSTWKASNGQVLQSLQTTNDVWGNIITKTESRTGTTVYENDASTGTLLKIVTPDGLTTEYQYDDLGRQIATILPDGTKVNIDYDQEGRVIRQWGSQQYPVSFEYDTWSQKTGMITYRTIVDNQANWPSITDGDRTSWIYESSTGNLLQKTYADGKGITYTYTLGGKIKTQTNARGNMTTHSYDGVGQLISSVVNDNLTPAQKFTYDQWGRQVSAVTMDVVSYQYTYNDQNQVIQEDIILPGENGSLNRQITRSYDQHGRGTGYQLKQGEVVEQALVYQYNEGSQLCGIVADGKEFHYDYVPSAPHLIGKVTSPVHVVTNSYEFQRDQLRNKSNSWKNKTDNPVISGYTYAVNSLGQRTSVTTSGEVYSATPADWQWQYDALGQVISANQSTYVYDQIGNRISSRIGDGTEISYATNALNQYATVNITVPSYDDDGNLLVGLSATSTLPERNQFVFFYNANNRPIRVQKNNEVKENYAYDHRGRRVKKGDMVIVYDGYNAIAEYRNASLQAKYGWGLDLGGNIQQLVGGIGGLICVTDCKAQISVVSYPTYDGNGNITEYLIEQNKGALSAHYEYDAYGNVLKKMGEKEYSYQFSTKPYDVLTGLSYYTYRDYESVSGRWIARDPLMEIGGMNLYAFASNSPLSRIDIIGLQSTTAWSKSIIAMDEDLISDSEVGRAEVAIEADCETQSITSKIVSTTGTINVMPEVGNTEKTENKTCTTIKFSGSATMEDHANWNNIINGMGTGAAGCATAGGTIGAATGCGIGVAPGIVGGAAVGVVIGGIAGAYLSETRTVSFSVGAKVCCECTENEKSVLEWKLGQIEDLSQKGEIRDGDLYIKL